MQNELSLFIKEALEKGQSREAIQSALQKAGWRQEEIANGLSLFADIHFPVAVPRPKPYLQAREAFLYLISFIALYVSAFSFGLLLFNFVDHWFPDPVSFRQGFSAGAIRMGLASIIVAFPLYLFVVVAGLLGGELTIRFILKALVVLAVTGSIFGYYLWSLQAEEKEK